MISTLKNCILLRKIGSNLRKGSHLKSSTFVRIVEVGPRDGLQNESEIVPTNTKIEFIEKLAETGLQTIEVTSFVSPKWVPQMADNSQVFQGITKKPNISYPVLVPNLQGLKAAIKTGGVKEVAVFVAASEGFARKNTNCSVQESVNRAKEVAKMALEENMTVRGYISCVVGCPYDGAVKSEAVARVAEELLSCGCYEISLGDTIGVGTKTKTENMINEVLKLTTADKLAIHCHDTYGQALVNILTSMELGIRVVDSSVSGLGGCPYADGATGNVATEDLIYMLHGLGAQTGVDLRKLIDVGQFISEKIKKPTASRVNRALYKKYPLNIT